MKIFKKKFEIIIRDEEKSNDVLNLIEDKDVYYKFAYDLDNQYFPRKFEDVTWETIGFKIESSISEKDIHNKLGSFYDSLDDLNVNYVLKDMETKEVLMDVDFEGREEIIVHFTSTNLVSVRLLRKLNKIKNIPKISKEFGFGENYGKIAIKNLNNELGFISVTIKMYCLLEEDLKILEKRVITELEKLDVEFELESYIYIS